MQPEAQTMDHEARPESGTTGTRGERARLPREPHHEDDDRLPRESPKGLEGLAPDELVAEVAALARRLSTGTYELLVLIGEVDGRGIWALHGALSCAAWLAELTQVETVTAHNQVRVARALRRCPALDAAMAVGDVSFAKARVLVPYLDDENVDELIALAETTPASRLGAAIAARSLREDDPDVIAARQHDARSVSWRTEPDGMVIVTARLEPATAGQVCAVIESIVTRSDSAHGDSLVQQRADALVAAITGPRAGGGVDTEVVIHVAAEGNTLVDGTPLADHAVTRLLPDAFVSLLVHDSQRRPIDASPRRRFPTRRQRRVVDARQIECQHPGCHATAFLEYDHVHEFAEGGPTVVSNLQRLCGPHNRAKHQRAGRGGPGDESQSPRGR